MSGQNIPLILLMKFLDQKILELKKKKNSKKLKNIVKEDLYHITVEIAENLFILISKGFIMIKDSDLEIADYIRGKVEKFTKFKVKETPSLNNKIHFQFLDLIDMI